VKTEKKHSTKFLLTLCWIVSIGLEGEAVRRVVLSEGEVIPLEAAAFHLLAALLVMVVPALPGARNHPRAGYISFLAGWLTLFLPVIGILGSLSIAAISAVTKSKGTVSDYQVMTAYRLAKSTLPEFTEGVSEFIEEEINIDPMLDILRGEDINFKRGVIKYLEQIGTPAAVRVLKLSLNDTSPEIQYYTHAALETLESGWMKRIEDARKAVTEEKDGRKKVPLYDKLGYTYWRYANSGLAADATRFHYYEQARKAFELGLAQEPHNRYLVVSMGKILLEEGNFASAEEHFIRAFELEGGRADALLGLCQVYFESGNQEALAKIADRMREEDGLTHHDPAKNDLIRFWTAEDRGLSHG
jgi:tetratricopeptide (TPR) repeat protein